MARGCDGCTGPRGEISLFHDPATDNDNAIRKIKNKGEYCLHTTNQSNRKAMFKVVDVENEAFRSGNWRPRGL